MPALLFLLAYLLALSLPIIGQKERRRRSSWMIAVTYGSVGICLALSIPVFGDIVGEFGRFERMNPISKTVLRTPASVWLVVFFCAAAIVWFKDRWWRWRHANLTCFVVLILITFGIYYAVVVRGWGIGGIS